MPRGVGDSQRRMEGSMASAMEVTQGEKERMGHVKPTQSGSGRGSSSEVIHG